MIHLKRKTILPPTFAQQFKIDFFSYRIEKLAYARVRGKPVFFTDEISIWLNVDNTQNNPKSIENKIKAINDVLTSIGRMKLWIKYSI